jgi:hypothetical protein
MNGAPTFRKLRVVGPRAAEADATDDAHAAYMMDTLDKQTQRMRTYNPTVNAMVTANNAMRNALAGTTTASANNNSKRKRPAQRSSASSRLATYNACLLRLHALKSAFDNSYAPLVQALATHGVPPAAAHNRNADIPPPPRHGHVGDDHDDESEPIADTTSTDTDVEEMVPEGDVATASPESGRMMSVPLRCRTFWRSVPPHRLRTAL